MWILIMTIIGYHGNATSTAEFSSKSKCLDAKNLWQRSIIQERGRNGSDPSAQPVAFCTEK